MTLLAIALNVSERIWALILDLMRGIARGALALAQFLAIGQPSPPARFMPSLHRWLWLDASRRGYLINGQTARLPLDVTYQGSIVLGGMGTGKSSRFIIPNLLQLPRDKPSFVVSDTSGEIFAKTSGYLVSQGYEVQAFNLLNVHHSQTYNPLAVCRTQQDVAELARILVRAGAVRQDRGLSGDPFWNQAAEKLIRVLAQCLLNQDEDRFKNLANLRHLILSFDAHRPSPGQVAKISQFVLASTQSDLPTYRAFTALIGGNLKTLQSILMTVDVALDALAAPEIGRLTAGYSLGFAGLRKEPTALFLMVNQTQIPLYRFLLNLIYHQLFAALLHNADQPGRPVWLLLDEFGHFHVEGFEIIATTARKYQVALHLALQSSLQLEQQYGPFGAQIIRDGLGSHLYLPGLNLEEALKVSQRLGHQQGRPLLRADQISRLPRHEALVLPTNLDPLKIRTRAYFEDWRLARRASLPPATLPSVSTAPVPLISL